MVTRILNLMDEKGVNATKLTADLGLPNSAVTEWKKGKYKPSADAIVKIAEYFGVSTDYLLTGKKSIDMPQMWPTKKLEGNDKMRIRIDMKKEMRQMLMIEEVVEMFSETLKNPLNFETVRASYVLEDETAPYEDCLVYLDGITKDEFLANTQEEFDKNASEMYAKYCTDELVSARIINLGVTHDLLKEWISYDFGSNPPQPSQLKRIYANYEKFQVYENFEKETTKARNLKILRAINNYIAEVHEQWYQADDNEQYNFKKDA